MVAIKTILIDGLAFNESLIRYKLIRPNEKLPTQKSVEKLISVKVRS